MMVTMSTVTPGSTHKSQPINMSTIMRNWVVSIGGGGVSHSRTGGPISGGRQLRYMNGEQCNLLDTQIQFHAELGL